MATRRELVVMGAASLSAGVLTASLLTQPKLFPFLVENSKEDSITSSSRKRQNVLQKDGSIRTKSSLPMDSEIMTPLTTLPLKVGPCMPL